MDAIKGRVHDSKSLVKIMETIKLKTEVIDEIVFQIKLISFNASVESERAGEHGRGFAVVAQEVGNLAKSSGAASKEISNLVDESSKRTNIILEENTEAVDRALNVLQELNPTIEDISKKMTRLLDRSERILKGSLMQASSIEQISAAMAQLDSLSQTNSQYSQENADVSTQLRDISSSLSQEIHQLNQFTLGKNESKNQLKRAA